MLIPRCINAPEDAIYCAKFFNLVNFLIAPDFNSILYFSNIGVARIFWLIVSLTEIEAKNIGIFFRESFYIITRKNTKGAITKQEKHERFKKFINFSKRKKLSSFINYRKLNELYDMQYKIKLKKFALFSLSVSDHHININAINVLFEIGDKWPSTKKECERLILAALHLVKREINRKPDIAVRAQRYMYELENFVIRNFRSESTNLTSQKPSVKAKPKKNVLLVTTYNLINSTTCIKNIINKKKVMNLLFKHCLSISKIKNKRMALMNADFVIQNRDYKLLSCN
jgi:hypothetical protein